MGFERDDNLSFLERPRLQTEGSLILDVEIHHVMIVIPFSGPDSGAPEVSDILHLRSTEYSVVWAELEHGHTYGNLREQGHLAKRTR